MIVLQILFSSVSLHEMYYFFDFYLKLQALIKKSIEKVLKMVWIECFSNSNYCHCLQMQKKTEKIFKITNILVDVLYFLRDVYF